MAENRELTDCERVAVVDGPEDVAFDDEGRLFAGAQDDTVYRTVEPVDADTTAATVEAFADLDGRPPGMTFDGESLLVTETSRYRVTRCWVDGPRAGETVVLADNLPGYPDNVEAGEDAYWVAVPALRDATLDRVHHHPWLVRQVGRLPPWVLESVSPDP
jgi:sugar lactone lactonase YvrE